MIINVDRYIEFCISAAFCSSSNGEYTHIHRSMCYQSSVKHTYRHLSSSFIVWEPSSARQRLDKHVPTVTKLFTLQRQQYLRGANILVTQDINKEARRFVCNRNKVI
jgi:uncharacterized protein YyaL (SSP411 family)